MIIGTPPLPSSCFRDGEDLTEWLGRFWTVIYKDADFLRQLNDSRAQIAAQLYLNFLEALFSIDRNTVPVFHRERWYPIVLKKSGRNKGSIVTIGGDPTPEIGKQTKDVFVKGSIFKIGGSPLYSNINTYKLENQVDHILTCIVDNVVNPSVILLKGREFDINNNTLMIRKDFDPFDSNKFVVDTLLDDEEVVLWACDVLIDRNYVTDHLGYIFGLLSKSSVYYKRLVNSIWDLICNSSTIESVNSCICAVFDAPCIQNDEETVEKIIYEKDSAIIATDQNIYNLPFVQSVPKYIEAGLKLKKGTILTDGIRIYHSLYNVNLKRLTKIFPFAKEIKSDIPGFVLTEDIMFDREASGLCLTWNLEPIYYAGDDKNGNPKLMFRLDGDSKRLSDFWNKVWTNCENENISLSSILSDYLTEQKRKVVGAIWGYIEPIKFFMENLIGSNTVIVVVNTGKLNRDIKKLFNSSAFSIMRRALPSYIRIYIIEHDSIDKEEYNLELFSSDFIKNLYVSKSVKNEAYYNGLSTTHLTYNDFKLNVRWIPVCK